VDLCPEVPARLHIHPRSGLVEDEEVRIGQQSQCEAKSLALASRAHRHLPIGQMRDPCSLHAGIHVGATIERGDDLHGLPNREVGQQPAGLCHRGAASRPGRAERVSTEDLDLAAVGAGEAESHVDGGGLPGAVRAEECHNLTTLNGE